MSEYTINYSIGGWPICKNGEPIFRKKLLLTEFQQLQAGCERLEAINLGLTKTLVEMEEEKAKLVGALDLALEYWADRQQRYKNRKPRWVADAESALAAYRKGDE